MMWALWGCIAVLVVADAVFVVIFRVFAVETKKSMKKVLDYASEMSKLANSYADNLNNLLMEQEKD